MPDVHPDLNWPPEPAPEPQAGDERPALDRSSRAQAWLADRATGVRKVRELEASPAVPEALAAGFTHRVRGAVGSGFAGGGGPAPAGAGAGPGRLHC